MTNELEYKDTFDEAAATMRMAIAFMGQNRLPANPVNYRIAYEYVTGANANLKQSVDAARQKTQKLDERDIQDIHNKVFNTISALDGPRESLRRVMAEVLKHIIDAGGETTRYSSMLRKYNDNLSADLKPEDIRDIVDGILTETKSMDNMGATLAAHLHDSSQEVETLRKELERVREEATIDALTRIGNRKFFDGELSRCINAASVDNAELCILFVDVDKFKTINDTHGHLVGDDVLRFIAQSIKQSIRGQDVACRYAGDEFAVLLPNTPVNGAISAGSNIIKVVGASKLTQRSTGRLIGNISVSLGVALYRVGESEETFIQRADEALYRAKKSGRNRLACEREE